MAYQKRFRTVVPIPVATAAEQDTLTVWLTRESFDRAAAAASLVLAEFLDLGTMLPEDVPPKAEKQLGAPATEFVWRVFEGIGVRA